MRKLALIRRSFRLDGGAETSTDAYMAALRELQIPFELICESWDGSLESDHVTQIATSGSRLRRAREFRDAVEHLINQYSEVTYQAHDWIPGANLVRLGDGLHRCWFDLLKRERGLIRQKLLNWSGFHQDRIRAEQLTLEHPRLSAIVVNSEFIADQVAEHYPNVQSKVRVIRNIVKPAIAEKASRLQAPRNHRQIGFAGSGWERKGLARVLEALALMPGISLLVAGQDKTEPRYRQLASRLGIADRVTWMGVVDNMTEFYMSIGALVHPAIYDPSPNVAIEAMAFGIPVITSRATGITDFQHYEGVFVTSEAPADLSQSVIEALQTQADDRDLLRHLALSFDQKYLTNALRSLYGDWATP